MKTPRLLNMGHLLAVLLLVTAATHTSAFSVVGGRFVSSSSTPPSPSLQPGYGSQPDHATALSGTASSSDDTMYAPLFRLSQEQQEEKQQQRTARRRKWRQRLSKLQTRATNAVGMAGLSIAMLQSTAVVSTLPAHAVMIETPVAIHRNVRDVFNDQEDEDREESLESILSDARSVLSEVEAMIEEGPCNDDGGADDVDTDSRHVLTNRVAAPTAFIRRGQHQRSPSLPFVTMETIRSPQNIHSTLKQHLMENQVDDDEQHDALDRRHVITLSTVTSTNNDNNEMSTTTRSQPVLMHRSAFSSQDYNQVPQESPSTVGETNDQVPSVSASSKVLRRVAAGGAIVQADRDATTLVAVDEPMALSEDWVDEFHTQATSSDTVASSSSSQLPGGGDDDDDGSDDLTRPSAAAAVAASAPSSVGAANPRVAKGVAVVAGGTAGVIIGRAIYKTWFESAPAPIISANVAASQAPSKSAASVGVKNDIPATLQKEASSTANANSNRLPLIINNKLSDISKTTVASTIAAIALGGGSALLLLKSKEQQQQEEELIPLDDNPIGSLPFDDIPPPAPISSSENLSIDDIQKQGWSKIFGAPNQQVVDAETMKEDISFSATATMDAPQPTTSKQQSIPFLGNKQNEITIPTSYPLMTKEFLKARQQPKSYFMEQKLSKKYASIESLQERSFQILLDLGMIQLTPLTI
mmetsp:Transcript_10724/g.30649  ORF Transcript_10724/g.30649 Transcript_10724/m.30649 type:complete len:697 (-) Transcript_10724:603-2693(-)